jgi:hypothetical protein
MELGSSRNNNGSNNNTKEGEDGKNVNIPSSPIHANTLHPLAGSPGPASPSRPAILRRKPSTAEALLPLSNTNTNTAVSSSSTTSSAAVTPSLGAQSTTTLLPAPVGAFTVAGFVPATAAVSADTHTPSMMIDMSTPKDEEDAALGLMALRRSPPPAAAFGNGGGMGTFCPAGQPSSTGQGKGKSSGKGLTIAGVGKSLVPSASIYGQGVMSAYKNAPMLDDMDQLEKSVHLGSQRGASPRRGGLRYVSQALDSTGYSSGGDDDMYADMMMLNDEARDANGDENELEMDLDLDSERNGSNFTGISPSWLSAKLKKSTLKKLKVEEMEKLDSMAVHLSSMNALIQDALEWKAEYMKFIDNYELSWQEDASKDEFEASSAKEKEQATESEIPLKSEQREQGVEASDEANQQGGEVPEPEMSEKEKVTLALDEVDDTEKAFMDGMDQLYDKEYECQEKLQQINHLVRKHLPLLRDPRPRRR